MAGVYGVILLSFFSYYIVNPVTGHTYLIIHQRCITGLHWHKSCVNEHSDFLYPSSGELVTAASAWFGQAAMAGHDSGSQHQFTGFQKYFNSYTITGRRNYVIATYTGVAMLVLYFKLRPKKKTPAVADK